MIIWLAGSPKSESTWVRSFLQTIFLEVHNLTLTSWIK